MSSDNKEFISSKFGLENVPQVDAGSPEASLDTLRDGVEGSLISIDKVITDLKARGLDTETLSLVRANLSEELSRLLSQVKESQTSEVRGENLESAERQALRKEVQRYVQNFVSVQPDQYSRDRSIVTIVYERRDKDPATGLVIETPKKIVSGRSGSSFDEGSPLKDFYGDENKLKQSLEAYLMLMAEDIIAEAEKKQLTSHERQQFIDSQLAYLCANFTWTHTQLALEARQGGIVTGRFLGENLDTVGLVMAVVQARRDGVNKAKAQRIGLAEGSYLALPVDEQKAKLARQLLAEIGRKPNSISPFDLPRTESGKDVSVELLRALQDMLDSEGKVKPLFSQESVNKATKMESFAGPIRGISNKVDSLTLDSRVVRSAQDLVRENENLQKVKDFHAWEKEKNALLAKTKKRTLLDVKDDSALFFGVSAADKTLAESLLRDPRKESGGGDLEYIQGKVNKAQQELKSNQERVLDDLRQQMKTAQSEATVRLQHNPDLYKHAVNRDIPDSILRFQMDFSSAMVILDKLDVNKPFGEQANIIQELSDALASIVKQKVQAMVDSVQANMESVMDSVDIKRLSTVDEAHHIFGAEKIPGKLIAIALGKTFPESGSENYDVNQSPFVALGKVMAGRSDQSPQPAYQQAFASLRVAMNAT